MKIRKFNEKFDFDENDFDEEEFANDDKFIITYASDGDEIHFMLMDMKHYKRVRKEENENGFAEYFSEDFLNFVYNNVIEEKFIQSYTDIEWFQNYNIKKVIYIPEFGQ